MNTTSYVIKELNKYGHTNISVVSRITEGLNVSIEQRVSIIREMQVKQNLASDNFTSFSDKYIAFTEKITKTIEKINNYYGYDSPNEVKLVINDLNTVQAGLDNITLETSIEEKVSERNILDLADILTNSLETQSIPSECPGFHDNFIYFVDAGLHLQNTLIKDYCQKIKFTVDNGGDLIKKANFFMDLFISEQGSFVHAIEPTVRAANSLVELLNVFY